MEAQKFAGKAEGKTRHAYPWCKLAVSLINSHAMPLTTPNCKVNDAVYTTKQDAFKTENNLMQQTRLPRQPQ